MTAPRTSSLGATVEAQSIRRYCDIVFGYLDGLVPIRLLPETGTPDQKPRLEFPGTASVTDRLISIASAAAEQQRGVFVVPGTVISPGSAKAKDIQQTGVILVDLDHGDISAKFAHLAQYVGPPSLEVASGGVADDGQTKLHLYWRLTEAAVGTDAARVAALRGMLASKVAGDPAFGSIHQPIRVAGTIHGKNGRRTGVRILSDRPREYELTEIAEAIAAMPPMPGLPVPQDRARRCPGGRTPHDLARTRIAAGGVNGETRFVALSKVIGHWIRNARRGVCTIEEAWTAVEDHNAAMIAPPWEVTYLRREFDALLARTPLKRAPCACRRSRNKSRLRLL
ncbi:hypothetical protein [Palleronia marisminoris]|nr:hypothetical protein [Palleronia marisminoris]